MSKPRKHNFGAYSSTTDFVIDPRVDDDHLNVMRHELSNLLDSWKESSKLLDADRLDDVTNMVQWFDNFLEPSSEGGIKPAQLQRAVQHTNLLDRVIKSVEIESQRRLNMDDTRRPHYIDLGYVLKYKKKEQKKETQGYAFDNLINVLTDTTQLRKVYKQNGSFISYDQPELSVIISEAITNIIEWCQKDNKNTYINKATKVRQEKINAFYESLRDTVEQIEASSDKKLTSYRLAAELNKGNVATYSKSGQWMPNMADRLKAHLIKDNKVDKAVAEQNKVSL